MIRRTFLITGTPLYIESFKNDKIILYEMDDNLFIECSQGHYYVLTTDDNHFKIDRIKSNGLTNNLNGYPKNIITKIRYYIPIKPNLDAKIDYCNDDNIITTINADFNTIEEADSFEIPNWFGEELCLITKVYKKQ